MATLTQLQARLDELLERRQTGIRKVSHGDVDTEFKSDSELAAAIADLERRIAALQGPKPVKTIYINSSKGL